MLEVNQELCDTLQQRAGGLRRWQCTGNGTTILPAPQLNCRQVVAYTGVAPRPVPPLSCRSLRGSVLWYRNPGVYSRERSRLQPGSGSRSREALAVCNQLLRQRVGDHRPATQKAQSCQETAIHHYWVKQCFKPARPKQLCHYARADRMSERLSFLPTPIASSHPGISICATGTSQSQ